MGEKEFKKIQKEIDKKCDELRDIQQKQKTEWFKGDFNKIKPLYRWRVWRKGQRILAYKPYPPRDKYHEWQ